MLTTWVGINEGIPVGVTSVTIAMSTAADAYPATARLRSLKEGGCKGCENRAG